MGSIPTGERTCAKPSKHQPKESIRFSRGQSGGGTRRSWAVGVLAAFAVLFLQQATRREALEPEDVPGLRPAPARARASRDRRSEPDPEIPAQGAGPKAPAYKGGDSRLEAGVFTLDRDKQAEAGLPSACARRKQLGARG